MAIMNQYCLLENVDLDGHEILFARKGCGLIVELSEEGVAHIWPVSPVFKNSKPPAVEARENQDLTDYLADGDWAVELPWMYFKSVEEVIALMNRNEIQVFYRDLGSHPSIRSARALLEAS